MKSPLLSVALKTAAEAVATVLAGRTPDALLAATAPALRSAVLDLVFSTLRDYGRGDFLLGRLLAKPLKDKPARALLLVALERLERRPEEAHTLVDQAVTAAGKPFKGLVNAVLRNFLRRRDALLAAADADLVAHWRHPQWWLEKLRDAYPDQWQDIAAAGNSHPPMCLRLNRRRPPVDMLAGKPLGDTALLLDRPVPVERLPGFREGRVSVQDWGAQQAASLLDARDGMRVLDACAAPGGKAAHLLEREPSLRLTALDVDAARLQKVRATFTRLAVGADADLRVADAVDVDAWWDGTPYDAILLDAPCSALGVVRRQPDILLHRRERDIAALVALQARLLDALWPTLRAGGALLYATCSVLPEENADIVAAFLARTPDASAEPLGADYGRPAGPGRQRLTGEAGMDGFYYARLRRSAPAR